MTRSQAKAVDKTPVTMAGTGRKRGLSATSAAAADVGESGEPTKRKRSGTGM